MSLILWNFSTTQILCEIKFGDFRSAKSAISTYLKALKFDFLRNFGTFWRLKFKKFTKVRGPKRTKTGSLELLDFSKLISRKIWVTEKSWNFHTVSCRLLLWHFTKRQILNGVSTFWGKASIDRRSCVLSTFSSWIVNYWKFLFYFLFCFEMKFVLKMFVCKQIFGLLVRFFSRRYYLILAFLNHFRGLWTTTLKNPFFNKNHKSAFLTKL